MINEQALIPYEVSDLPSGPWLVFAPHPDDETFGMGGSLLLAAGQGINTSVVIVTNGALGGDQEAIAAIRFDEAQQALQALGVQGRYFWNLPDREWAITDDLILKVAHLIGQLQPQSVFFPSPMELHPDHRQTALLVWEGLKQASSFTGTAYTYEIGSQGQINYLIDITAVVGKKNQVMALYASQLAINNYIQVIQGLDCARTYTLPNEVQAAEGFWQYKTLDYSLAALTLETLRPYLHTPLKENIPLVSIIVRTKNRPGLLAEAVQSICGQTYPNIEIIVVNDGGDKVDWLLERFKATVATLRLFQLPTSLGRTGAANHGLKQASGTWIGFLDDDDLLAPQHIQTLISAALPSSAKVVYSGTQVLQVNPDGTSHEITEYNQPYSAERLLYRNFIPIHSALVHRGLIDDGVCFDSHFDLFEDWDYWLQLSQKTEFLHSPLVTAIYRLHANASGVHQIDHSAAANRQIYSKWLSGFPMEKTFALLQKSHEWMAEDIAKLQDINAQKLDRIGKLHSYAQSIIQERDGQIASLQDINAQKLDTIDKLHSHAQSTIQERDRQIASLLSRRERFMLKILRNSKSLLITTPLRLAKKIALITKQLHSEKPLGNHDASYCLNRMVEVAAIPPSHPVVVIVPVYRDVDMSRRCILAAMPGVLATPGARIIAINDRSPDEGMQAMLEQLAEQWPEVLVLERNEKNLGFVGTVNFGFSCFPRHDAVLLNSDAIVPDNWLARLIDEAYSRPDIATVTPFSNNATIASFPHFLQENPQPFGLDVNVIDAVFKQGRLPAIEVPTGVGFCLYIRRACLDSIGQLNQEKFGRGYGEENDFCQRALKAGWLNIITPNLYVHHEGGVSFAAEKQRLVDNAMRVLKSLHPNYHADVQTFIRHDPVKPARVARYAQLLSTIAIPKVLLVSHCLGGGVTQHIEELSDHFSQKIAFILLTPYGGENAVSISFGTDKQADKLVFTIPSGYGELLACLQSIGINAIHFHHTLGLHDFFLRLPEDLGIPHLLTVHDYYWLNANPTLTGKDSKYPGYYSDSQSNPLYAMPAGQTPATWQTLLRPLFENASGVIFPSYAAKLFFDPIYPIGNSLLAAHIEPHAVVSKTPRPFIKKNRYVIGSIGAISREKGADILEDIAGLAKSQGLPLKFKLIGYAYRALKVIETIGGYENKDLGQLIRHHHLDIIFFTAQWPETYSYTLSHALDSGLAIIAPTIGAFPERLSGRANTLLFNHLTPAGDLLKLIEAFIGQMEQGQPVAAPILDGLVTETNFYDDHYYQLVSNNIRWGDPVQSTPFIYHAPQVIKSTTGHKPTLQGSLLGMFLELCKRPSLRWFNPAALPAAPCGQPLG